MEKTLKLALDLHITGMRCFSASLINFHESKAEQPTRKLGPLIQELGPLSCLQPS